MGRPHQQQQGRQGGVAQLLLSTGCNSTQGSSISIMASVVRLPPCAGAGPQQASRRVDCNSRRAGARHMLELQGPGLVVAGNRGRGGAAVLKC
jgi:hypothetical protein